MRIETQNRSTARLLMLWWSPDQSSENGIYLITLPQFIGLMSQLITAMVQSDVAHICNMALLCWVELYSWLRTATAFPHFDGQRLPILILTGFDVEQPRRQWPRCYTTVVCLLKVECEYLHDITWRRKRSHRPRHQANTEKTEQHFQRHPSPSCSERMITLESSLINHNRHRWMKRATRNELIFETTVISAPVRHRKGPPSQIL